MNELKQTRRVTGSLLGVACLLLGSLPALADTAADVQKCQSGATSQSQQDCMREAGAVRQQGTQGQPPANPVTLEANAEQRCQVLPEAERSSCLLRMQGEGTVSGSVSGGGIYRELKEPQPPVILLLPPAQ